MNVTSHLEGWWAAAALGWILAVAVLLSSGCGGSAAAPSDPYAGRWSGSVLDDSAGTARIELVLSDAVNLAGTWTIGLPGLEGGGTASLLPTVPGDMRRHLGLRCGPAPAGSVLLSTWLEGDDMVGTYLAACCAVLTRGSVRLGRLR